VTTRVTAILEEALSLPIEARAMLADRLIESLDEDQETVEAMWIAEAKRRRDDIRSGKVQAIPGDEAMAIVRSALNS